MSHPNEISRRAWFAHTAGRGAIAGSVDRRTFLRWSALVGAGAATGILFGCASGGRAPAGGQPAGGAAAPAGQPAAPPKLGPQGDLVIIQGVDIESLDPHVTTSGASKGIMWAMYDKLLERAPDMKIIPWLAESYRAVDDTTWEFKLRQGVEFHNGETFTAKHVQATINRFRDPKIKNVYASQLKPVKEIQIVDDHTVRLITDGPFGLLPEVLATYCEMLPMELIEGKADITKKAIGTGPYRFVSWSANEKLVMEAAGTPHFSGQPKAKTITWRPVPEGSTRVVELKTGKAHLITPVTPVQAAEIESSPELAVVRVRQQAINIIVFNLNRPYFKDKRVRQALSYATDVDGIIKSLMRDAVYRSAGPFGPGVPGYDPSLRPYPYDPEKAKALLRQAGFANGFELTLATPSGRYLNDKLASEAIAGMWEKVGVRAKVQAMEWAQFVQAVIGKQLDAFFFLQGGPLTDATVAVNFHSGKKGAAWQGYENPEVDKLADDALKTLDGARREKIYQRLSQLVHEDAPWLFLWNPQSIFGVSKKLKGWEPHLDGIIRLGGMSL